MIVYTSLAASLSSANPGGAGESRKSPGSRKNGLTPQSDRTIAPAPGTQ